MRDEPGRHQRAHGPRAGDGEGESRPLGVHPHPPQSRAADPRRRPARDLRQRDEPPQLLRPRPGTAGRRPRELPGPPQAHPVLQLHPLRGRLPGGARRHPSFRAPPRLPPRQADPHRQGRARLFARFRAGRRRDGDDPDRGRTHRRGVRGRAADVHQHQLDVSPQARLADARRRDAPRAARPADHRQPFHPRGRDGAGDPGPGR